MLSVPHGLQTRFDLGSKQSSYLLTVEYKFTTLFPSLRETTAAVPAELGQEEGLWESPELGGRGHCIGVMGFTFHPPVATQELTARRSKYEK